VDRKGENREELLMRVLLKQPQVTEGMLEGLLKEPIEGSVDSKIKQVGQQVLATPLNRKRKKVGWQEEGKLEIGKTDSRFPGNIKPTSKVLDKAPQRINAKKAFIEYTLGKLKKSTG
jgi:hypothetical protein